MIIGVDPGKDKCGVAVLDSNGEVKFSEVIATSEFEIVLQKLSAQFEIELAILGNGTTHANAEKKLRDIGLKVLVVDEKFTTEQARKLYWKKFPPQGWRKFLPTSMQVPPVPVDNLVAEILINRYLGLNNG
ncbi:MAG: pre-16S rRNA-processing nuclease YqgF [Selenomonadaceae bacterium]|nr:pre-16S rRNA-processing nuclease YqgF [Selenomonadaceae bacterium]